MSYPGWIRWWKVKDDLERPFKRVWEMFSEWYWPDLRIIPRGPSLTLTDAMPAMRATLDQIRLAHDEPPAWAERMRQMQDGG